MKLTAPLCRSTAALLMLCLSGGLLTACGGGGTDSPGAATAAISATSASTPTPASTPATLTPEIGTTTTDTTCGLPGLRNELLAEVNRQRAAGRSCGAQGRFAPAVELHWNDRLAQAAQVHALDMITAGFFSHTGSNGSTVGTRVTAAGYDWVTVAENIAAGQPTAASVMAAWLSSDGHCANVMNPSVRDIAVVCIVSDADLSAHWVMDLARAR